MEANIIMNGGEPPDLLLRKSNFEQGSLITEPVQTQKGLLQNIPSLADQIKK